MADVIDQSVPSDVPPYHGTGLCRDVDIVKVTKDEPPTGPVYHGDRGDRPMPNQQEILNILTSGKVIT